MIKRFDVTLLCHNCGHTWTEGIPVGMKVKSGYGGVWLHPSHCLNNPCQGRRPTCPNCERHEEVRTTRAG